MKYINTLNRKTFTAIWNREFRIMWFRLVLIVIWIGMAYFNFGGKNHMEVRAILQLSGFVLGMVLGADFGNRDLKNGFKSILLDLPVNQGVLNLNRFMVRLVVAVAAISGLMLLQSVSTHNMHIERIAFYFLLSFLTAVCASLVFRRIIVTMCMTLIMMGLWYIAGQGFAFQLYRMNPNDPGFFNSVSISLNPIWLPMTGYILLGFTVFVTVLLVSGMLNRYRDSIQFMTFRHLAMGWLTCLLLYIGFLSTFPAYCNSLPIDSAVAIINIVPIPDSKSIIVNGYFEHGVMTGNWLVTPGQESRRLDFGRARFLHFDANYSLFSTEWYKNWNHTEIGTNLYRYSISDSGEFKYSLVQEMNEFIALGSLRHSYMKLNPAGSRAVGVKTIRRTSDSVMVVNLNDPIKKIQLKPFDFKENEQLYALGWYDDDHIISLVSSEERNELWLLDVNGSHRHLFQLDAFGKLHTSPLGIPSVWYNSHRNSVIVIGGDAHPGRNPRIAPENLSIMEYLSDGSMIEHQPEYSIDDLNTAKFSADGQSIFLFMSNSTSLYDLSHDTMKPLNGIVSSHHLSPDTRHTIKLGEYSSDGGGHHGCSIWSVETDQEILHLGSIYKWAWQDNDHIVVNKRNGQLGSINIHTGEFELYFDFDWRKP